MRKPRESPEKRKQRELLERLKEKRAKKLIEKAFLGEISREKMVELNQKANGLINDLIVKIIVMPKKTSAVLSKKEKKKIATSILKQMSGLELIEQKYFLKSLIRQAGRELKAAKERKARHRVALVFQLLQSALRLYSQKRFAKII